MANKELGQIITAMVTPFDKDLEVDYGKAAELVKFLAENGSDGILVAGTTGESPTLTHQEKIELFRTVKSVVGDKVSIIAGTGTNNTRDTIAMTREAEEIGVDAVLIVTPYYNKPPQEGIYRHFEMVAASTSLPVIVYNIPGRTGVNITPETMQRLSKIPNIVADKEAAGSVDQCSEMVAATGAMKAFGKYRPAKVGACVGCSGGTREEKAFSVYSGDDSLTLPMLSVGAVGVISVASHVAGPQMKKMINSFFRDEVEEAQSIHMKLMPLFKGLFTTTNPILVKSALRMMGFEAGGLRSPLISATTEQEKALRIAMEKAGLL